MKRARLLAFVLTAAMATTVFLGGTVARYQTTASIDDTATVAKWGVKLTMAGNLYGEQYLGNGASDHIPTANSSDVTISVQSDSTSNLLAPGTKSTEALKIELTGDTEVDTQLTATVSAQDIYLAKGDYAILQKLGTLNEITFNKMKASLYTVVGTTVTSQATAAYDSGATYYVIQNELNLASAYYPVTYTYKTTGNQQLSNIAYTIAKAIQNTTSEDVDENANVSYSVTSNVINSNTNLNTLALNDVSIVWEWDIGTGTNDKQDTILGTLMGNTTTAKSGDDITITWDGSNTETYVVKKDGSDVYQLLSVGATGLVLMNSAEVGSVKTSFSISITVAQVD